MVKEEGKRPQTKVVVKDEKGTTTVAEGVSPDAAAAAAEAALRILRQKAKAK